MVLDVLCAGSLRSTLSLLPYVLPHLLGHPQVPCLLVLTHCPPVPVLALLHAHLPAVLPPPKVFPDLQVRSDEIVTQPPENRLPVLLTPVLLIVLIYCGDLSCWGPPDLHLHHISPVPFCAWASFFHFLCPQCSFLPHQILLGCCSRRSWLLTLGLC